MSRKIECVKCKAVRYGRSNIVSVVTELMVYEDYCFACAKKFLKDKKFADTGFYNVREIKKIAELYNLQLQNEVMQDDEKRKKVLESEPFKKIMSDFNKINEG